MSRKKRTKKNNPMSIASIESRAKSHLPPAKHPAGADRCFIIDGHNLAYIAYYSRHGLSSGGKSTAIMYGMLQDIRSLITTYPAAKLIVCWDGQKHPERLKLLPTYKSHREKNMGPREKKRMLKEMIRTRKLLYYLGVPQAYNPDMEGDDMVYWMTKKYQNLFKVWIVSGDKDMCQLINYDVQVYNPRTKDIYSTFAFICDQKVEVNQYIDYLCLIGDKSDDIPGYYGIGPVRAAQFLYKFKSIKNFLDDEDAEFSGISDKDKLRDIWKRNRMMIGLKKFNETHHRERDATFYKGKTMPKVDKENFYLMCNKYNLRTFLTPKFITPFEKLNNA